MGMNFTTLARLDREESTPTLVTLRRIQDFLKEPRRMGEVDQFKPNLMRRIQLIEYRLEMIEKKIQNS